MFRNMNLQTVEALARLTRLKPEEGLLVALHPDFILMVRPGMSEGEREDAADALLSAAEGLSLPVMENASEDAEDASDEDGLYLPPDMLEEAGFLGLDYEDDLIYTVEDGRIIIETEDE